MELEWWNDYEILSIQNIIHISIYLLEVYYQDIISINESISGNLFIWFFKLLCTQEPRQKWVNAPFDEMNSFYNGNENRVQPSSNQCVLFRHC